MIARTILCIDDDTLLLDFLVLQLEMIASPMLIIHQAATGVAGLKLARECQPDLAILDIGLPDMSGFSVAAQLIALNKSCRILLVSGNLSETTMSRLLDSQIHGCLLKSTAHGTELKHALTELTSGRTYFPEDVLSAIAEARRQSDHFLKILSPREIELVPFLGYGWANERIAACTGLSQATVRTHHQNILSKLGLHGREELMRWAIKKGFVDFRYEPEALPDALHEDAADWSV